MPGMIPILLSGAKRKWTPARIPNAVSFRDVGGGASCFTTTGGTTRSTAGTAAARVIDSINPTFNALGSSSAPTYQVGANGKPFLEFNGSGNRYDDVSINPAFSAHCLAISAAGYHCIYDTPGSPSLGRMLWIDGSSRPEVDAMLVVGSTLTAGTYYTVFVSRTTLLTRLWINNVLIGTVGTVRGASSTISEFNRGGISTFNGRVSSWGYWSSLPSQTNRTLLHDYMMRNVPT